MFDLSNLNDFEFEILCKDILQEILNEELFVFSRGIDAGVDICDKKKNPTIIIQAKHYINSSYPQLKYSLKKEISKIQQHHPQKYFICTSLSLTRKNKLEIIEMFNEYMHDTSYVKDKNDISSFLENEQNKDIVAKNYKLWLCASGILSLVYNQNVFIDCSEFIFDIEEQIKLFVETQAYHDAIQKLNHDRIIIIIGAPGVGKSTVSKMLLLYYANKGYGVRYVTNNNISDIKRSLNLAPNKKEIILLDDFLGQHYFNLKDSQPNELKTLIAFVAKSSKKKLILNSRVTILNEATQTYLTFRELMGKYENNKYLLDLDKMSAYEKAKILYNHLYFNKLPREYSSQVRKNQGYLRIVKHMNYSPRIIEYVTQRCNYKIIDSGEYTRYIVEKLNNPEDVWKDEFRNRLDVIDRIFMNTLYSLTDTTVDNSILEQAFNGRIIREAKCDTSINQYKETVIRLTNSLIKNVDDRGNIKIAVINPSVNDYLLSEIQSNPSEQITIIDHAVFYEQVFKVLKSDESKSHYREKIFSCDYLKMKTLENSAFFYFLKSIVDLHILDRTLTQKVTVSLECAYRGLNYRYSENYGLILKELYSEEYCEYYELHNIFLSPKKMSNILKPLMLADASDLICTIIYDNDISDDEKLKQVFKEHLINKISDYISDVLSDELADTVANVVHKAEIEDIEDFMNENTAALVDAVSSELEELAYSKIQDHITPLNDVIDIEDTDFDITDIRYCLNISDSIESVIKADFDDDDNRHRYSNHESDDTLIKEMFER